MDGGYICNVCRKKHEDGEVVYSVLCSDGLYETTCSIECFNIEKRNQLDMVKEKLKEIEKQLPVIDVWWLNCVYKYVFVFKCI